MAWLGMSIPSIPGTTGNRPVKAPGTRKIEREQEKQRTPIPEISSDKPDEKPVVAPTPAKVPLKKD